MSRILLFLGLLFVMALPPLAQEAVPGDACTDAGAFKESGGAQLAGAGHMMVCQGGTWKSVLSYDANGRLTEIGNSNCAEDEVLKFDGTNWICGEAGGLSALQGVDDAGPCTLAKNGLIKFNAGDDPPWHYCDGGTTSWLPFRLPQCQNDDAGECTLAALRNTNDPQFKASSIRCGEKVLGVTGTYGEGSGGAFTWADVTGANPSTLTTTGTVSISGIPAGCPASVIVSGQGSPQVSIAGGTWGSGGVITNGQTLAVRLTSGIFGATNAANVAIGSTEDGWSVTTRAANNCTAQSKTWLTNCTASVSAANHGANGTGTITNPGGCGTVWYGSGTFSCVDGIFTYTSGSCTQQTACDTTPNAFSFTDRTFVALNALIVSNIVQVSGITGDVSTGISGAGSPQYRICSDVACSGVVVDWTNVAGVIQNNQYLQARLTSASSLNTLRDATLTVGTVSDVWSVRTTTPVSVFLTSGSSWTVPANWNSSNNKIECIGGGGGGGAARYNDTGSSGGGGGAYSSVENVALTVGANLGYSVGSGGSGKTRTSDGTTSGGDGADTYFCNSSSNCASISGTAVRCGAKGGDGGNASTSGTAASAAGGSASGGVGSVRYKGGSSGSATAANGKWTSGGGGAAGPNGNGLNSGSPSGGGTHSGGKGDAGVTAAGADGTQFSASYGVGGGGYGDGGGTNVTAGDGGSYGAGGGGVGGGATTVTSGAGSRGLIVITYTP